MRANKDEGKPEPHTLAKFANPYFKDTSSMVSYLYLARFMKLNLA